MLTKDEIRAAAERARVYPAGNGRRYIPEPDLRATGSASIAAASLRTYPDLAALG